MATPSRKVERYLAGVTSGKVVAGRLVRLAVERHLADLETAGERGFYFDAAVATEACDFFPRCCNHSKGEWAGRSFELSASQAFIVWSLFGWRRLDDDTRRFRSAYVTCARKWGKSEFGAGIGLLLTTMDYPLEPGAEVFAVATKEDQAKITTTQAARMVRRSPGLTSVLNTFAKAISSKPDAPQPDCSFKPIGSDSKTSDGYDLHGAILDELHAWGDKHQGLYDRMTTAGGSRRQPLILIITTAGDDNSVIWQRRDAASVAILEASSRGDHIGDNHFAFIARIDEQDDPFDEVNWPKANPNMEDAGTPKLKYLREQAEECKPNPVERNKFVRFHCNRQVSASERAIDDEQWKAAAGDLSDWSTAEVVTWGGDMGGIEDLAAVGLVAKFDTGERDEEQSPIYRYEVKSKAWVNAATNLDIMKDPWATFVSAGLLTVTEDEDAEMVKFILASEATEGAYDPARARTLERPLRDARGDDYAVQMPQSYLQYNEPIVQFLRALKQGRVKHDGCPLLAYAVGNLQVKPNSRNELMPDRKTSKGKIDPIVAVLMAFRMAYFSDNSIPMIW